MAITVSPSKLSAELRAALDLPAGAPPPWQARLLAFGLPIDYRVPDFDFEKSETVEQAVPKVETRLSSQTGREQQNPHTVVADDAFRVRLGPKFATVFGEQRQLAPTSSASHASASAQTHRPHIPKQSMGAQPDMSTFYEDPGVLLDTSKLTAQEGGVPQGNAVQATPPQATPADHACGSHSVVKASAVADVAQQQQPNCASDGPALAEESTPSLPGLSSAKAGATTTRLRGSGWHGDEKRSKSRKRSHAGKTRSPQHGSTHRSLKRPADQPTTKSHNLEHPRPEDADLVAAQGQPRHNPQAAVESRPVFSTGISAGPVADESCRNVESDDDDVIYVRTAQHWRHEVMDLVSDEDCPDDPRHMSTHLELLDDEPAIPVMETLHHDGRSTCHGAAVSAPQLQTFTQAADVSAHTPQIRSEIGQPDLRPASREDGHYTQKSHTNQEGYEPISKAHDRPEAEAEPTRTTAAPETIEHEDRMAEADQEDNQARHKSRKKPTDRSRSHHKSAKSSKSRSKHRTAHEKERSRNGSAERDRSRHDSRERRYRDDSYDRERDRRYREPRSRRHRDDEEDGRAHKRHHHDRGPPHERTHRGRWSPAESLSPPRRGGRSPRWHRGDTAEYHDDHWRRREWQQREPAAASGGDLSAKDEHRRRQDWQRREHGAVSKTAAADRQTRAGAGEGGGATRQPRAGAGPAPAAAPVRRHAEHGAPQRAAGDPAHGSGDGPAGDARAGGVCGQAQDEQRRQVAVRFTAPPSPRMPGVPSPEQPPQQGDNKRSEPRDTRKAGDARVGQFLPRRTASAEMPRHPVMPRQGSAGEASKQQPGSVGGFLARSNSATKAPLPAAKAPMPAAKAPVPADPPGMTGHFLVRRDSATAGPARAARDSEPHAKHAQAASSTHARIQVEKKSPVKQAAVKAGQSTAVGRTGGPGESTASPVPVQPQEGPVPGEQPPTGTAPATPSHPKPKQPQVATGPTPQAPVIKHVEPKNDDDEWFTPAGESEQGPLFTSPFEYWGINAPLKGADTFRHKKQWMQAEFLPVQLTNVLLRNCEARIKLFFAISNRG